VAAEMRAPVDSQHGRECCPPAAATDTKQCFAPWDVPIIDKDGKIFPCCYAVSNAAAQMGDLHDTAADAIWQGESFSAFRSALLDGRTMPDVCRTCTVVPTGPHPLRQYGMRVLPERSTLVGGTEMCLAVQNVGVATWTGADRILIGTANPRDGHSAYYDQSWIGRNRICSFSEAVVPPGTIATFRFHISPSTVAADESFQIVIENQCWVPGTRFTIESGVEAQDVVRDDTRAEMQPPGVLATIRRLIGLRS
jgi:radical SAM protein with 4Fe4S-binding SPASM domain